MGNILNKLFFNRKYVYYFKFISCIIGFTIFYFSFFIKYLFCVYRLKYNTIIKKEILIYVDLTKIVPTTLILSFYTLYKLNLITTFCYYWITEILDILFIFNTKYLLWQCVSLNQVAWKLFFLGAFFFNFFHLT